MVISASHNPYKDNGIKVFAPSGRKLDEETERLIEKDVLTQDAHPAHRAENSSGTAPVANDEADSLKAAIFRFPGERNRAMTFRYAISVSLLTAQTVQPPMLPPSCLNVSAHPLPRSMTLQTEEI